MAGTHVDPFQGLVAPFPIWIPDCELDFGFFPSKQPVDSNCHID